MNVYCLETEDDYFLYIDLCHIHLNMNFYFQRNPEIFNRASLLNIGYLEAMKTSAEFDCIFFHDVDIYMEDGRAMYSCDFAPVHLAAYTRGHNYQSVLFSFHSSIVKVMLNSVVIF